MNVDTKQIYFGAALLAAQQRGEPLEDLSCNTNDETETEAQEIRRRQTGNGRTREFLDKLRKVRQTIPR